MIVNKEKPAKDVQDLERYDYIAKYFEENPSRVMDNVKYLDHICGSLGIMSPINIDISDEDVQEKVYLREKSQEITNRLKSMNLDNLLQKLWKIESDRLKEGKSMGIIK
ncbi:MAG: hypothetical protein ABIE36_02555 [Candidatus Diapherotrites archaeon]